MLSKRFRKLSVPQISVLTLSFVLLFTPPARTQVASPSATISASGVSQIRLQQASQTTPLVGLLINIQERGTESNRQGAIGTLQERVKIIRQSIEQVGIPASSIQVKTYTVSPSFEQQPRFRDAFSAPANASPGSASAQRLPMQASAPPIQPLVLSQSLEVRTSSERLPVAMDAAIRAGANSVSVFSLTSQGFAVQPDLPNATLFVNAVKEATQQAQASAQASAQSTGVKLGGLRSIAVQSPSFSYGSSEGAVWRVQVNLVYSVAP